MSCLILASVGFLLSILVPNVGLCHNKPDHKLIVNDLTTRNHKAIIRKREGSVTTRGGGGREARRERSNS